MKLAVITSGYLPIPATKGGAVETLVDNLLKENEKFKRIEFNIFSIYDEKAVEDSKQYSNTNFTFIKTNFIVNCLDKCMFLIAKYILRKENSQSYRFIFQRLYYLNKVSKFLNEKDFDKIILENHPTQYLALKWRKNYIKYQNKYYYHCHNEFPSKYGCEEIMKGTNKFISVSKFRANNIKEYLNFSEEKFIVLKNCIDTEKFSTDISKEEKENIKRRYKIKNYEKILLYVGRLVPEKGIKELIEALKRVEYKNYKLLVVGSALNTVNIKTKYEEEIQKNIEELKEKIIFTGFINYEEINKIYLTADISIIPSICDDSAPLTIIESMVAGLPIITTDSGGIPEYVNSNCAIILKRDNTLIEKLAENINFLLEETYVRRSMSIESKKNSSELNLDGYYNSFIDIIEKG